MLELCKEYYEFNERCQILSPDFIKRYVEQVKLINNITFGIKEIKNENLQEGCNTGYSFQDRRIYICFSNIIEMIEDELECKFDIHNIDHVARLNKELIINISHECYHGLQAEYLNKSGERTLQGKLFSDSLNERFYKKVSYDECYYYIPTETNATILGRLFGINFINLLTPKEVVEDNNAFIAKQILELFLDEDCNYIIPTETFYEMTGKIKRYKEIMKIRHTDNYKNLILGLDIGQSYIDKLLSLAHKKTKTDNIKIYLKNK